MIPGLSPSRRPWLLVLLTVIMVFNYVDRLALGLMLQDIKVELQLSDTQLGVMTGIAFAFFYATMGIPIARWADSGNRVTIISVTAAVWSIAVAACGAATSFVHLLLARVLVAIGEAGCHPPAFSLLSDYYSKAERPRAIARYMLGWPLAGLVGYFAAGWLNEIFGWRITFVILGLPGLALAAIAAIALYEPRRGATEVQGIAAGDNSGGESLLLTLSMLWRNATFRRLLLCFSLSYFFGNGILQWQPAFFVRSHGIATGELGTWLAVVLGVGGLIGTVLGGELTTRYAANNERLQLTALAVLFALLAVVKGAVYLAPNHVVAFAALGLATIGNGAVNGPLFAATQTLVPPRMRAMSIAIVLFFSNLIGMGLGPLAAGALSDLLRPALGEESLRYALLALCPGYLWCTWQLLIGRRTVEADVLDAQKDEVSSQPVRPGSTASAH